MKNSQSGSNLLLKGYRSPRRVSKSLWGSSLSEDLQRDLQLTESIVLMDAYQRKPRIGIRKLIAAIIPDGSAPLSLRV